MAPRITDFSGCEVHHSTNTRMVHKTCRETCLDWMPGVLCHTTQKKFKHVSGIGARVSFISLESLTARMAPKWASSEDLLLASIRKEWARSFPESIALHSHPVSFSGQVIVIGVDTAIRQREFSFLEPHLRQSLKRLVPDLPDCSMRFRVIRPFTSLVRPSATHRNETIPSATLEHKAAEIVSGISDTRIRGGAFRFVLFCLMQGALLGFPDSDDSSTSPTSSDRRIPIEGRLKE